MIELAKYKNFLIDKELYTQNKFFWNDTIINLSENTFEEWVSTKFSNGEDFFDGNPIFSAFYPDLNKAIRIIQLPVDENISSLRIWLDNVNHGDKSVKELVLVLQPNDKAYNSTISLITLFLSGRAIGKYINSYNTFYKKQVDLKISESAIKPFNDLNRLNIKQLQNKDLDISVLRKIYKKAYEQNEILKLSPNRHRLKRIEKEIENILNILTINNKVNFNSNLNKDTYLDLVESKYGFDNYVYKLHKTSSYIDALNKASINSLIT